MTNGTEPRSMTDRFREMFEALSREGEPALPRLRELYHERLQFQDPIQAVHGCDAYIEATRRLLHRGKSLSFNLGTVVEQNGNLFAVWTMTFEPKMGPAMAFQGVTHATFREGRIVYRRDYWDLLSSAAEALPAVGAVYRMLVGLFV